MDTALVKRKFEEIFNNPASILVQSPGRINVIGEHIDYNHGYVMPAAIDKKIVFAASVSPTDANVFHSLKDETMFSGVVEERVEWGKYILAIMKLAMAKDLQIGPIRAVFDSSLPIGAGLSSSTAFSMGILYCYKSLFSWELSPLDMALFGQEVEQSIGVECGLMDQYAIAHGVKDTVLKMDCIHNTHEAFAGDLGDYTFHLLNSNVPHKLEDTAYNDRRKSSESALKKIQKLYADVKSYRDLSHQQIESVYLKDNERDYAEFIIEEIDRVHQASKAYENGDVQELGDLLNQSHQGLSEKYKVCCQETDFLANSAIEKDGVAGIRQVGGGFGGCMLLLVQKTKKDSVIRELKFSYKKQFDIDAQDYAVDITDGISVEII